MTVADKVRRPDDSVRRRLRGECSSCGRDCTLNTDGSVRMHTIVVAAGEVRCPGVWKPPRRIERKKASDGKGAKK
jgi:hypothetical protein